MRQGIKEEPMVQLAPEEESLWTNRVLIGKKRKLMSGEQLSKGFHHGNAQFNRKQPNLACLRMEKCIWGKEAGKKDWC